MIGVDTSVLAIALNRHVPGHARALQVIETLANGDTPWGLPWSAAHEFLALVTHPHAVARPLRPAEAWGVFEELTTSDSVRMLGPTGHHAKVMAEVLAMIGPAPGLPPGLVTAVLLREHGVRELLTCDRAMRRFPFLSLFDPVHDEEPWTPDRAPRRRYRMLAPRSRRR